MFGNDPWKMAAQGYAFMFPNDNASGTQRFVSISALSGLASEYEPTDTVTGRITLTNPRQEATDLSVVFSLVAAGTTAKQSQPIHLEAGASQEVGFSIPLPGPVSYYAHADVSVAVSTPAGALLTGTSGLLKVNPYRAYITMAPQWPVPSAGDGGFPAFPIHIENANGARAAGSGDISLIVTLTETSPSPSMVQKLTISPPPFNPARVRMLRLPLPAGHPWPGTNMPSKSCSSGPTGEAAWARNLLSCFRPSS